METINLTINISKITSGKCDFFTFWETNSKRLEVVDLPFEPFILKPPHSLYPYPHHMRNDDLLIWKKYSDKITSYSPGLKAQAWENCMKHEIYKIITNKLLDGTVEHNGKLLNMKVVWTGPAVPIAELEYK